MDCLASTKLWVQFLIPPNIYINKIQIKTCISLFASHAACWRAATVVPTAWAHICSSPGSCGFVPCISFPFGWESLFGCVTFNPLYLRLFSLNLPLPCSSLCVIFLEPFFPAGGCSAAVSMWPLLLNAAAINVQFRFHFLQHLYLSWVPREWQ